MSIRAHAKHRRLPGGGQREEGDQDEGYGTKHARSDIQRIFRHSRMLAEFRIILQIRDSGLLEADFAYRLRTVVVG